MATKTTSTKKETGELFDRLLADLATLGVKPKLVWSPSGQYCRMVVADATISFTHRQGRSGVRVEPRVAFEDLSKTQAALFVEREGRRPVGYVVDAKTSKAIAKVIAAGVPS